MEGVRLFPEIMKIEDVGVYKVVHEAIRRTETPEELYRLYQRFDTKPTKTG